MTLVYISISLFALYSILILYYCTGWQELKPYSQPNQEAFTKISLIIPARNEEENIGKLLSSIERQTYPKHLYEVIIIDDHSTDNTATIVNAFSFAKLIRLESDN